jgi:hypothetical protein
VSDPCTVLIAAADLLPALQQRTTDLNGEVLTFSDGEVLRALEVIMTRRPGIVAIERLFAATPRGVALINRIRADPTLMQSEIRLVSHDSESARMRIPGVAAGIAGSAALRTAAAGAGAGGISAAGSSTLGPSAAAGPSAVVTAPASAAVAPAAALSGSMKAGPVATARVAPSPVLDQRGTRRAARFKIAPPLDVLVDGNAATLIDLSTIGAQVVSKSVLKPNQRVRIAFNDEQMTLRFNGAVAWAWFEIPPQSGPCYRAGIEFVDADQRAVEAFCVRHRKP